MPSLESIHKRYPRRLSGWHSHRMSHGSSFQDCHDAICPESCHDWPSFQHHIHHRPSLSIHTGAAQHPTPSGQCNGRKGSASGLSHGCAHTSGATIPRETTKDLGGLLGIYGNHGTHIGKAWFVPGITHLSAFLMLKPDLLPLASRVVSIPMATTQEVATTHSRMSSLHCSFGCLKFVNLLAAQLSSESRQRFYGL